MTVQPEIPSNGLDWMLTHASISDPALAQALGEAYFRELYGFARLLTPSADLALDRAASALGGAVRQRSRISGESSLRAWLYRQVYRPASRFTPPRSSAPTPDLIPALAFGHALSPAETAAVLGLPLDRVLTRLAQVLVAAFSETHPNAASLQDHLPEIARLLEGQASLHLGSQMGPHPQDCPACRAFIEALPRLEQRLRAAYEPQPAPDPHTALQPVLNKAGLNGPALRRRFPWRELALVAAVLVGMIILGSSLDVLTPFDARPTPTPVPPTPRPGAPTPLPPLVLPGVENQDYFFFQYHPGPGDTYEKLAELTGLTADQIRALNRAAAGSSLSFGRELRLALIIDDQDSIDPRTPLLSGDPPLSPDMTIEEIGKRMVRSSQTWRTLQAESLYVYHGPRGYIGPPRIFFRFLTWAQGSRRYAHAMSYFQEESPDFTFFHDPWSFYAGSDTSVLYGSRVEEEQSDDFTAALPLLRGLMLVQISPEVVSTGEMGDVAGRPALSLRIDHPEIGYIRLWVDAQTGLVLSLEAFELGEPHRAGVPLDEDGQLVLMEIRTRAIEYNLPLPQGWDMPTTSPLLQLAGDVLAQPPDWTQFSLRKPIQEKIPPPEGWDPASAPLTFQRVEGQTTGMDIFAGGWHLGSHEAAQEDLVACRRSPSGLHAAFTASGEALWAEAGSLYLLHLDPFRIEKLYEQGYQLPQFAFSPDGASLAYLPCTGTRCSLRIRDLDSGEEREISSFTTGYGTGSLIWIDDSTELTFLIHAPSGTSLVTVDAESGEVLIQRSYDPLQEELVPQPQGLGC
jgi:hypothetical protein